MKGTSTILKFALLMIAFGLSAFCLENWIGVVQAQRLDTDAQLRRELTESVGTSTRSGQEFPVPFIPLPKTITPCRACHGPEKDFPVNLERREALLVHRNVKLNHGDVKVWCLDCHDPENRNFLRPLSDGKLIDFEHSYLLCGKCHGTKYRDWRNGIHGRRSGDWNGPKMYYLCVNCHDPHSPRFQSLAPMPAPERPWTPKEKSASH
jgi:hypothetical protein